MRQCGVRQAELTGRSGRFVNSVEAGNPALTGSDVEHGKDIPEGVSPQCRGSGLQGRRSVEPDLEGLRNSERRPLKNGCIIYGPKNAPRVKIGSVKADCPPTQSQTAPALAGEAQTRQAPGGGLHRQRLGTVRPLLAGRQPSPRPELLDDHRPACAACGSFCLWSRGRLACPHVLPGSPRRA